MILLKLDGDSWLLLLVTVNSAVKNIILDGSAMHSCMCVCMYVILLDATNAPSNKKHKKQSQNDVQYKATKPKKTISLDKAI